MIAHQPHHEFGVALVEVVVAAEALRVDRASNGLDLTSGDLFVEDAPPVQDGAVRMGPRIGVEHAGSWAARPWRFWIAASPLVSRTRLGQIYDGRVVDDANTRGIMPAGTRRARSGDTIH